MRGVRLARDNNPSPRRIDIVFGAFAMSLTLHDVHRIAELSRLELQTDEASALLVQLNDFFRVVEQMGAVDTAGVEPLYTPLSATVSVGLRLRDDDVTETDRRDANLQNAPAVDRGLFLVPKVIE